MTMQPTAAYLADRAAALAAFAYQHDSKRHTVEALVLRGLADAVASVERAAW